MRFAFDEDVVALRDEARRFLQDSSGSAAVRRAMAGEPACHPALWRQLCEMGWTGLIAGEAHGGAGLSWVAVVGLLEETGRALLCAPLLSTLLVQAALAEGASSAEQERWLPALAAGQATGAVALGAGDDLRAEERGGAWVLTGCCPQVTDGGEADVLVVAAGDDAYLVQAAATRRQPRVSLDLTRPQARVELSATSALRLAPGTTGRLGALAAVAVAAEQAGGARACLHMSVDYAKIREQFGRPIGSFQAVQHICADMMERAESARSAAWYAGWAAQEAPEELPKAAAVARVTCSQAYLRNAADNIQVHGGVGFTWEHDAHLHLKRARWAAAGLGLGDVASWRRRYADERGL